MPHIYHMIILHPCILCWDTKYENSHENVPTCVIFQCCFFVSSFFLLPFLQKNCILGWFLTDDLWQHLSWQILPRRRRTKTQVGKQRGKKFAPLWVIPQETNPGSKYKGVSQTRAHFIGGMPPHRDKLWQRAGCAACPQGNFPFCHFWPR